MYISLLGRQPELSIAELERLFTNTRWFTANTALFDSPQKPNVQQLGGSQKIGKVIKTTPATQWKQVEKEILTHYRKKWSNQEGKITLGISVYSTDAKQLPSPRDVQKTGLTLKGALKKGGVSLRLIPNKDSSLSSATSHHNKLGLSANKIELIIVLGKNSSAIAESLGAQNITALATRDQGRPKRDAFVGMLPPKLAQIIINLAAGSPLTEPEIHTPDQQLTVLDPFCGTGVLLQEALLLGYNAYGTDLAPKMIDYSEANLKWLQETHLSNSDRSQQPTYQLSQGDAVETQWQITPQTTIAAETYLGQPFSAPPSQAKLIEVQGNCNHIIGGFLKNLGTQLNPGTPIAIAVPAWRSKDLSPYGNPMFTHLPLVSDPEKYGFNRINLENVEPEKLLYFRPEQVVAREILILRKI